MGIKLICDECGVELGDKSEYISLDDTALLTRREGKLVFEVGIVPPQPGIITDDPLLCIECVGKILAEDE